MEMLSQILVIGGTGAIIGVLISSVIWSRFGRDDGGGGGFSPLPIDPGGEPIDLEDKWDSWMKTLQTPVLIKK